MKAVSHFLSGVVMTLVLVASTIAQEKPKQGDDAAKSGGTSDAWKRALPERDESASPVEPARATSADVEDSPQVAEKRLREMEQTWANALNSGDGNQLRQILAADFALAGTRASQLVVSKKQYVADAVRDAKDASALSLDEMQVRLYLGAAVVNGRLRQPAAAGVEGGDLLFTDLWIRGANGWKAVSRHISRVPAGSSKMN